MSADAEQGAKNRRNGAYAEESFLPILRKHFPNAERTYPKNDGYYCGDYKGIDDLILDATTVPWTRLTSAGGKMDQAARDASDEHTGYGRWAVVKRHGVTRWVQWYLIGDADTWLGIWAERIELRQENALLMDELEQTRAALAVVTAEADEAYDRGMRKAMRDLGAALRGETA